MEAKPRGIGSGINREGDHFHQILDIYFRKPLGSCRLEKAVPSEPIFRENNREQFAEIRKIVSE